MDGRRSTADSDYHGKDASSAYAGQSVCIDNYNRVSAIYRRFIIDTVRNVETSERHHRGQRPCHL